MAEGGCGCGRTECTCGKGGAELYWCELCEKFFDSKRCPQCGMKLKKVKQG